MSVTQTIRAEVDTFIKDVEKIFNEFGADFTMLKNKLTGRIDAMKNKIDDHANAHIAQTQSNAGQPVTHDVTAQLKSELAAKRQKALDILNAVKKA